MEKFNQFLRIIFWWFVSIVAFGAAMHLGHGW